MTRHPALSLLTVIVLGLLLGACAPPADKQFRLGTNIWPGYEPIYLARQLGHLDDSRVRLVEYSAASQVIQAYRNQLIDAAALTLDEAMLLQETGESPQIVLVTDISRGADAIVARRDITRFEDLRNRRVGVEASAVGGYLLSRALELHGMDPRQITLVNLRIDEQEQAFLAHQVDAVVTFEPVRSKLLASGGVILFDSAALPDEIVDVVVVRKEKLQSDAAVVQHLLDAWYAALDAMAADPQRAAAILGQRMQLDVSQTLAAYQGLQLPTRLENHQLLSAEPKPSLQHTAAKLKTFMLERGLLKQDIDVSALFPGNAVVHNQRQRAARSGT